MKNIDLFELVTTTFNDPKEDGKEDEIVSVIIKTTEKYYVPEGIDLRSAVSDFIITANVKRSKIRDLNNDSKVVSVSIGQPLYL